MTGTFLTRDELRELTDAKRRDGQIAWLEERGWPFETTCSGWRLETPGLTQGCLTFSAPFLSRKKLNQKRGNAMKDRIPPNQSFAEFVEMMGDGFELMPHQKELIARIDSGQRILIHYPYGRGKSRFNQLVNAYYEALGLRVLK